jgi:hypothetical protein
MTILCNKNITKQLNSYSYVIVITLQCLLQRTKRALRIDGIVLNVFQLALALPFSFLDNLNTSIYSFSMFIFSLCNFIYILLNV